MDDNKAQESKKTVVAFVAGLLIGGLLVWVFSGSSGSSTSDALSNKNKTIDDAIEEGLGEAAKDKEKTGTTTAPTTKSSSKDFSFKVADQPKGSIVLLGEGVKYPTEEGWIAVHEEVGGELGNVLGASRYHTGVGLEPTTIDLLRNTEAGKTYHVVYYTESGDRMFDRREDTPMTKEGGGLLEATFVAK